MSKTSSGEINAGNTYSVLWYAVHGRGNEMVSLRLTLYVEKPSTVPIIGHLYSKVGHGLGDVLAKEFHRTKMKVVIS